MKTKRYTLPFALLILVLVSCNKKPTAGFTASENEIYLSEKITFTSTSTGAASYEWDFGDGTFSTEPSPIHVYETPGNYTVTLKVYNKKGKAWDRSSQSVTVHAPMATFKGYIDGEYTELFLGTPDIGIAMGGGYCGTVYDAPTDSRILTIHGMLARFEGFNPVMQVGFEYGYMNVPASYTLEQIDLMFHAYTNAGVKPYKYKADGGVRVYVLKNGKFWITDVDGAVGNQTGSTFKILSTVNYVSPPEVGTARTCERMKIKFNCKLYNSDNTAESISLTNGEFDIIVYAPHPF